MNRARSVKVQTSRWFDSSSLFLNRVAPSLVHDYANNRYYNTASGETSFPFSATRTTNATQFDAQGNIVWAPANLLTRSDPSTAVVGSPGSAPTGWGIVLGSTNGVTRSIVGQGVFNGIPFIDLQVSGTFTATENITVTPAPGVTTITATAGESWTGSIFWQIISGVLDNTATPLLGGVRLRWGNPGLINQVGSRNVALYEWTRDFNSAIAPATTTVVGTDWVWSFSAGQDVNFTVRIGAMQLERTGPDSPKPYNVTTGSAFYGPRLDYNPLTGEPLGLLIEEARTNDVATGFRLVPANVSTGNTTTAISPNTYLGGWPAVRVTGDGLSASHFAFIGSGAPSASTARSVAAIIRPVTGTLFQLTISANWSLDNANSYVNFDCTGNGSITFQGTAITNAFIRPLKDGCYHIGLTCTANAAPIAGALVIVGLINSGSDARLPGFASSNSFDFIYAGNCLGSGWNSIIPTVGSSATKGADNMSVSTGSWLDATKGTMYVDFTRGWSNTAGSGTGLVFASLGSDANNYMAPLSGFGTHSSHRFDVVNASVATVQITTVGSGVTVFTRRKHAAQYQLNNFRAVENGGTVGADTVSAVPTINTLAIGRLVTATGYAQSWIREFRYYQNVDATDAQLQSLTT
jgi:hypothetical protein